MSARWMEWSEEAFRRSREEDKPILLFLGTAWCSVCRSMEETLWGDPGYATWVEREYIPVYVDAEERPDLNERYNAGGWPTTAFLTPQGGVLWGSASGDPAQIRPVLMQLRSGYVSRRERLEEEVRKRDEKAEQARRSEYTLACKLDPEIFRKTVRGIVLTFDSNYGGFGREPKFPMCPSLQVLLSAWQETGGPDLREITVRTLDAIAGRGMFDSVDGGFFRYCEGEGWTHPHTEKLCEENAALIRAFLDAYLLSGEPRLQEVALRAIRWVQETLWDSERERFSAGQAAAPEYFSLPKSRRGTPPPVVPAQHTSSAAQMCSTFLRASVILDWDELREIALRCLGRILREAVDPEKGVAQVLDPGPRAYGLAKPIGFLVRALLDGHEVTGDYLEVAQELLEFCERRFWSEGEGLLDRIPGFEDWGELARPRKNVQESAIVAEGALRLSHLRDERHREFAARILASFPNFQDDYGHYTAEYALACDLLVRPVLRIDLVQPPESLRQAALALFAPRKIVRHGTDGPPGARLVRGSSPLGLARTPEELMGMI